ncbi:MAG: phospholipase D-like domain-containing protein [Variovorax sp.]
MSSVVTTAKAYANNAVAYVAWETDGKVPGCVGFEITRIYADGTRRLLAAWVPFEGQKNPQWIAQDTSVWPVQKFTWRDLTARQRRDKAELRPIDSSFTYQVRALVPARAGLDPVAPSPHASDYQGPAVPLSYVDAGIVTNQVRLTADYGDFQAAFNSGILSTQWLTRALQATLGRPPTKDDIQAEIQKVGSPIRTYLAGDLPGMLQSMFDRLDQGGELYLAIYELTDPFLLGLITAKASKVHLILSNTSKNKAGQWDDENSPARQALHHAGLAEMHDRMFNNSAHIGHNKFAVHVDGAGQAQAVLSGSTNWTPNGLCAQSNNCFIAELPELAAQYLGYWQDLKTDNADFATPSPLSATSRNVQGTGLRTADARPLPAVVMQSGALRLWRSPNTRQAAKPATPALPPDLAEVYGLMRSAKRAIFFAVFLPGLKGATSIIEEAIDIGRKDTSLLIYGAISSAMAMPNYNNDKTTNSNAGGADDGTKFQHAVFEEGGVHVVRASALTAGDVTGDFERELLSAGNAIIHDKILVIDPVSDDPVVVTGSHNLGYKASYGNDDNLVIIRRNPALAQAYMVHILDLYEHYRFRSVQAERLHDGQGLWSGFLKKDDSWQDKNPGGSDLAQYLASGIGGSRRVRRSGAATPGWRFPSSWPAPTQRPGRVWRGSG